MRRAQHGRPLATRRGATQVAPAAAPSPSPLLGVALLKVALELKRRPGRAAPEVLAQVLARLRIPEEELQAYLARNDALRRVLSPASR
jgi:hypothetical protein